MVIFREISGKVFHIVYDFLSAIRNSEFSFQECCLHSCAVIRTELHLAWRTQTLQFSTGWNVRFPPICSYQGFPFADVCGAAG